MAGEGQRAGVSYVCERKKTNEPEKSQSQPTLLRLCKRRRQRSKEGGSASKSKRRSDGERRNSGNGTLVRAGAAL